MSAFLFSYNKKEHLFYCSFLANLCIINHPAGGLVFGPPNFILSENFGFFLLKIPIINVKSSSFTAKNYYMLSL